MSEKNILLAAKQFAWVLVTALCWIYASRGYTNHGRFDLWFWGIAFSIDLVVFFVVVASIVSSK